MSLSAPEGILSLSDTCEVAITALAGGEFQFPKGSKLVRAVYAICITKVLQKPLTVNIQHCVLLETSEQCDSLKFVRAPLNNRTIPYTFKFLKGGPFTPGSQYGSISCTKFSLIGVVLMEENREEQENQGEGENEGGQDEGEGQGVNGEGQKGG